MSSDVATTPESVASVSQVDGQLIMPFYVICDVSGSMAGDIGQLNDALSQLRADIMSDPVVDDLTMLSVITFDTAARTVVALAPPSAIQLPRLQPGGATNYGSAFREYHRAFEADRARLKGEGKKVYRPCMFFLSDGEPTDADWLQTFQSLFHYNPGTGQGNRAFPYVVSFGFRDAKQHIMEKIAYPDFGTSRGRWFIARTDNVSDLLKSMTHAIGKTVISSGLSAGSGAPQIVAPAVSPSSGMQFGEAGDTV